MRDLNNDPETVKAWHVIAGAGGVAIEAPTCAGCIMSAERDSVSHTCGRWDALDGSAALAYAVKASRSAVSSRRIGMGDSVERADAADDIASAALTVCYSTPDVPVNHQRIAAAVRTVALNYGMGRDGITYAQSSREKASFLRHMSLDRPNGGEGGTLMEALSDTMGESDRTDDDAVSTLSTMLPSGRRISVERDSYGIILESAMLTGSDGTTVLATGAQALQDAYVDSVSVKVVPTVVRNASNAVRAVGALGRDVLILSFVGTAADAVLAGLAPTAGAFRAALCAARKRESGLCAHSAAVKP